MNTIALLSLLFGMYSTYKIYVECKNKGIKFSAYETTPLNVIGFSLGVSSLIFLVIHNIHYLFMMGQVLVFMYDHNLL